MAGSHLCEGCGLDLSRTARTEVLGGALTCVVCPACRLATTRRRSDLEVLFRRALRIDAALTGLCMQLAFLAVFTAAVIETASGSDVRTWLGAGLRTLHEVPIGAALLAGVLGTWLTAAFGHLHPGRVWLGWTAWITIADAVARGLPALLDAMTVRSVTPAPAGVLWSLVHTPGVHALTALAVTGIPPGLMLRRAGTAIRRQRWRWRRRVRRRTLLA
ncbi:MAG: hypothetical protein KF817_13690 [Phycisphaeraceae bacterium]|nr:hypothetical protein [Phycisphaeraceae bacterium]